MFEKTWLYIKLERICKELSLFLKVKLAKVDAKKYDNIIFLGYNCEPAFCFYKSFKFLDSSLFAWSASIEINNALENFDKIGTEGFEYLTDVGMFKENVTSFLFHGKTELSDDITEQELEKIVAADSADLSQRVNYLKEKFKKQMLGGGKNLFIRKIFISNSCQNFQEVNGEIEKLYNHISKICQNKFDILLIIEEKYKEFITLKKENVYIRTVKNYSSDKAVIGDPDSDRLGWKLIFKEFRPKKKIKKKKKFKFE